LSARAAETIKVSLTADHWDTAGVVAFTKHKGVDAVELVAGSAAQHIPTGKAILKDLVFRDGTIELDVDPTGSMGAGLGFRRRDNDNFEQFYLRPNPTAIRRWTAYSTHLRHMAFCSGICFRNTRRRRR
jgi:hypothetical protein